VHGNTVTTDFAAGTYKCNLFVCEMGHCGESYYVPLINPWGLSHNPPLANQWADDTNIPNWTKL